MSGVNGTSVVGLFPLLACVKVNCIFPLLGDLEKALSLGAGGFLSESRDFRNEMYSIKKKRMHGLNLWSIIPYIGKELDAVVTGGCFMLG